MSQVPSNEFESLVRASERPVESRWASEWDYLVDQTTRESEPVTVMSEVPPAIEPGASLTENLARRVGGDPASLRAMRPDYQMPPGTFPQEFAEGLGAGLEHFGVSGLAAAAAMERLAGDPMRAQRMEQAVDQPSPYDPQGVGGFLGQAVGNVAPSAAAFGVGMVPTLTGFGISGLGQGVTEARHAGADFPTQLESGIGYGIVEVATETLGVGAITRLGPELAAAIGRAFLQGGGSRAAIDVLKDATGLGLAGAAEEALASGLQNAIARGDLPNPAAVPGLNVPNMGGFDPDRPLLQGVPEAAGMGAVGALALGGAGGAMQQAFRPRPEAGGTPPSPHGTPDFVGPPGIIEIKPEKPEPPRPTGTPDFEGPPGIIEIKPERGPEPPESGEETERPSEEPQTEQEPESEPEPPTESIEPEETPSATEADQGGLDRGEQQRTGSEQSDAEVQGREADEPAPTPTRRRRPRAFSKADIERRVIRAAEDTGYQRRVGDNDEILAEFGIQSDQYFDFNTKFAGPIPAELKEALQGRFHLMRYVTANAGTGVGAGGEDALQTLGVDNFVTLLERLHGGRAVPQAIEHLRRVGPNADPAGSFAAWLYESLPERADERTDWEVIENPADELRPNETMRISDEGFTVVEDDGYLALVNDENPDQVFWLDAFDALPVDVGTRPAPAAELPFPVSEEGRDADSRSAGTQRDTNSGIFGQTVIDANTGAQQEMAFETESPADAAVRRLEERAPEDVEGQSTFEEVNLQDKPPPSITIADKISAEVGAFIDGPGTLEQAKAIAEKQSGPVVIRPHTIAKTTWDVHHAPNRPKDDPPPAARHPDVSSVFRGGDVPPLPDLRSRRRDELERMAADAGVPQPKQGRAMLARQVHAQLSAISAGRKRGGTTTRVEPDPIKGEGKPKKLREIVLDIGASLGQRIRQATRPSRRASGTYYPSSGRLSVRFTGDLSTTAHEIGHAIDDRYGLLAPWDQQEDSPYDHELIPAFSQHGSTPPMNRYDDPGGYATYQRWEGLAEWLRAFLINPHAARRAAPMFTAYVESTLPEPVMRKLQAFGHDIRVWAGALPSEKTLANVETDVGGRSQLKRMKRNLSRGGAGIDLTWTEKLRYEFADDLAPIWKAVNYALEVRDIDQLMPREDPRVLLPLFRGFDAKWGQVLAEGWRDTNDQPMKVRTREEDDPVWVETDETIGGIAWLLEPFRESPNARSDMDATAAYMVSERVREKFDNENRRQAKELAREHEDREWTKLREEIGEEIGADPRSDDVMEEAQRRVNEGEEPQWFVEAINALRSVQTLYEQGRENQKRLREVERRIKYVWELARRLSGVGAGLEHDVEVAIATIEEIESGDPDRLARIRDAARRYRAFADAALRYAVESGRFSEEQYEQIKRENEYWVAFDRMMDDDEYVGGARGQLATVRDPVKRFTGSTRPIQEVWSSMFLGAVSLMQEADRNRALRSFRDLLVEPRAMYQGKVRQLDDVGSRAEGPEKDAIRIFVHGEPEYWQFDPAIHRSLKNLGKAWDPALWERLAHTILVRVPHAAITHSPSFLIRNVQRDVAQRAIISRVPGAKPWDPLYYVGQADQYRQDLADFYRFGGGLFGHFMRSRSDYYRDMVEDIDEIRRGKMHAVITYPGRMIRGYSRFASHSEIANRVAEFRRARAYARDVLGYDEVDSGLYAAAQARDLVDYARAGRSIRQLNRLILFLNASIQGLSRNVRGFREEPARFAAKWTMYAVGMEMLFKLWRELTGDDDEWNEQPAYRRDLFHGVKIAPDTWFLIPKPWELGALASGVSRAIDQVQGDEHAWDGYMGNLLKATTPADEQMLLGPMTAIAETMMNHDLFRDRPIVSPWEESLAVELRAGKDRSSRLGQAVAEAFSVVGAEIDPRKVDHVIGAQLGGIGHTIMGLTDIGREDRRGFSIEQASGVVIRSPAWRAKDVKWVLDYARRYGLENSRGVDELKTVLKAMSEAKERTERDRLARYARELARQMRRVFEESRPGEAKLEAAVGDQ